jgi:hypothetical protein
MISCFCFYVLLRFVDLSKGVKKIDMIGPWGKKELEVEAKFLNFYFKKSSTRADSVTFYTL